MDHFTSSKYVHKHVASSKQDKGARLLFLVNLVNRISILYNICMLSSNDNVRQKEPQKAFWA